MISMHTFILILVDVSSKSLKYSVEMKFYTVTCHTQAQRLNTPHRLLLTSSNASLYHCGSPVCLPISSDGHSLINSVGVERDDVV